MGMRRDALGVGPVPQPARGVHEQVEVGLLDLLNRRFRPWPGTRTARVAAFPRPAAAVRLRGFGTLGHRDADDHGPGLVALRIEPQRRVLGIALGPRVIGRQQDRRRDQAGIDRLGRRLDRASPARARGSARHPARARPGSSPADRRSGASRPAKSGRKPGRVSVVSCTGIDHEPAADREVVRLQELVEPGRLGIAQEAA